jgi:hypothetical protein
MTTRTGRTSRRTAAIAATVGLLAVPAVAFGASLSGPAGGDLTGTYPDPQIAPSVVGGPELAGNAITHDTSVLNSALGNFSSKIGDGAVGRSEIAKGQVQADELGAVSVRSGSVKVAPGDAGAARAYCEPGERVLSGGGTWTGAMDFGQYLYASTPYNVINGWTVRGVNESDTVTGTLRADVICLG